MESKNIHKLNDDCLLHIFQYLSIIDRIRIERVCHRWREISLESWRTFKRFDLSRTTWGLPENEKITYLDTKVLKKILNRCGRFLNYFDICKSYNELETFKRIDHTKLQIFGSPDVVLKIVETTCPRLQTIFISDPFVNLYSLQSLISRCQNIENFCLVTRKWIWDEDDLGKLFSSMSKLKYLKISCNNLTGKCLSYLPEGIEGIHLKAMIHSSSLQVSNAINRFYKLRSLSIDSDPSIDVELLKAIVSRNDTLQELKLSGYIIALNRIEKLEIRDIVKFENLRVLDLQDNCYITNEVLETLASSCKRILYINISECVQISEKGLSYLTSKLELEHLIANGLPRITGENFGKMYGLKTLECRRCHNLKEINLCRLIWMAPYLEVLDLSWNNLNIDIIINFADVIINKRRNSILNLYIDQTNINSIVNSSSFLNIINITTDV